MSTTAGHLLPYELLLAQLETLDVCSSLFPLEGELTLSTDTRQALPLLRLGAPSSSASSTFPSALIFTLLLSLARPSDDHPFPLSLTISLPLSSSSPSTEPPPAHLTLHQPPWLSRSAHAALAANLSALTTEAEGGGGGNSELILEAVEWLREEATSALPVEEQEEEQNKVVEEEWRVWFVLVSLSTREKRDDMVRLGFRFVYLAGPALC